MPLPPGRARAFSRQENRAVLAWRGAVSAGLVSTADWAYMKAPVPRPTLRLVDKVSRSCGHTPGKVAGQRATVKAEINGVTPQCGQFTVNLRKIVRFYPNYIL